MLAGLADGGRAGDPGQGPRPGREPVRHARGSRGGRSRRARPAGGPRRRAAGSWSTSATGSGPIRRSPHSSTSSTTRRGTSRPATRWSGSSSIATCGPTASSDRMRRALGALGRGHAPRPADPTAVVGGHAHPPRDPSQPVAAPAALGVRHRRAAATPWRRARLGRGRRPRRAGRGADVDLGRPVDGRAVPRRRSRRPGRSSGSGSGGRKPALLERTCGGEATFRAAPPGDTDQTPHLTLRVFEQDGAGQIARALGSSIRRSTRRILHEAGVRRVRHDPT